MPKEEPTEEEIKKIMEKAEKTASEGKTPPKTPKDEPGSGGTKEPITEEKEPTPEAEKSSAEMEALKNDMVVMKKDMSDVKGFLKKMVERAEEMRAEAEGSQAKTAKEGEVVTGEGEGQDEAQEELTTEEELKMLQKAQAEEGAEGGDQSAGKGAEAPPSKTMMMFLLGKVLDNLGKVLPAALQSRAPAGGEATSLAKLAEELLIAQIKRQIGGGALGGDNMISTQQLQTLGNIQGMMFNNYWNTVKNMPKPIAQQMIQTAIEGAGATKETIE